MSGITSDSDETKITGGTDETTIGNIGDRLKVDTGDNDSSSAPGCPVFTNKLRSLFDGTSLTLTASYQTRYTYSGSGKLLGFILNFDTIDAMIKLTVDSDVIFELDSADLQDIQVGNPLTSGPNAQTTTGGPSVDSTGKKFLYMPPCPIVYGTNVKIEVKSDGSNRDILRSMVTLTKET